MPGIELIGTVEDTEVVGNAVPLDVGVLAAPLDRGRGQVGRGGPEAAEAPAGRKPPLEAGQVGRVQDEAFKVDPAPVEVDFHPTVDDPLGGQRVGDAGDSALLQRLVDGEAVESAADADGAHQGHQQRALRVALADSVGEHGRGRQFVAGVVAKGDLVAHEVVDRTDPIERGQLSPAPPLDQGIDGRVREVEKTGGLQQARFGVHDRLSFVGRCAAGAGR